MSGTEDFQERLKRIGALGSDVPSDGSETAAQTRRLKGSNSNILSLIGISPSVLLVVAAAAIGAMVFLPMFGPGEVLEQQERAAVDPDNRFRVGDPATVNNYTPSGVETPYMKKIRANAKRRKNATETDRRAAAYSGRGGSFEFPQESFNDFISEDGELTAETKGFIKYVQER